MADKKNKINVENNILIISINVAAGRKGDLTQVISIYLHVRLFDLTYYQCVCNSCNPSKTGMMSTDYRLGLSRLKPLLDSL